MFCQLFEYCIPTCLQLLRFSIQMQFLVSTDGGNTGMYYVEI